MCYGFLALGQKTVTIGNNLGASAFYGAIIPHNGKVTGLAANIYGLEMRYAFTGTEKDWQKDYRFPTTGIVMQIQHNGLPELTGTSIGVGVFANFRVFHFWGSQMFFRPTGGIGYLTKKFDMQENPSNRAIGSHFNIFAGLHGIWQIPLSERLLLNLGAGGNHFSNGNSRMPNLGINSLQFMAGVDFYLKPEKLEKPTRDKQFAKTGLWEAMLVGAARQTDHVWVHHIVIASLRARRSAIISPRSRLTGGVDFSLDKFYYFAENRTGSGLGLPLNQFLEIGLTFGHHLIMGRTSIVTELGTYAYQPNDHKDNFFQRVGLRYEVKGRQFVWMAIKSHYFQADYLEFGWGIGFGKKEKK